MTPSSRVFPATLASLCTLLSLASFSSSRAAEFVAEESKLTEPSAAGGGFSYTIEPVSPLIQMHASGLAGPYFFFLLTNTSGQTDTFHMTVDNISIPDWIPGQVCVDSTCFIDSTDVVVASGATSTVGVKIDPLFTSGVGTGDFHVNSVGNPSLTSLYTVTLYAFDAAVGADPFANGPIGEIMLRQNVPNPVRGSTSIDYALPHTDDVSLRIYDVTGRVVRTLANGLRSAGRHTVSWDGRDESGAALSSGIFYYRLSAADGSLTRRMTVIR